jgi:hypothetical protein
MYLTAQRVIALEGTTGINAFLHRHGAREIPGMSWENPNVELIAERFPGDVVALRLEVPPGRNRVRSYLDIAARDSTDISHILSALDETERGLRSRGAPRVCVFAGVAVQFCLEAGLEGHEAVEFRALKDACLRLLESGMSKEWKDVEPLTIEVSSGPTGIRFALDGESTRRVIEKRPPSMPPRSVSVDQDTKADFEQSYGDVIPHIILALTGLKLEDVVELGGVRVKEIPTGRILREWPKRPA